MLRWLKHFTARRERNAVTLPLVNSWLRGRYDAATTSDSNRNHWAYADGLSANAANTAEVRRTLRNRSRYEAANNSYARGIVLTLANDVIGTGPRLQLLTDNPVINRRIETAFAQWARSANLPAKLRTMRMACAADGEAFAILTNNSRLTGPVTLDLELIEADQITTPDLSTESRNAVDGIVFDADGNPREYHILRNHPGDVDAGFEADYDAVPAEAVLHLFRTDRPGQRRGVPEITPALPLFAMLRDYSLATLDAAKAAAYFSAILYTDAPPNGETEDIEPLDAIQLRRNMMLTMPGGWKLGQLKAEQPAGTYAEFKHEILNEIARCLNMPFNIAAANSSGYNYASGRLDHQTYHKSLRVEQSHIEAVVLDRILAAWFDEAALIPGLLPDGLGPTAFVPATWFWDGHEHVDPLKEARAQEVRLKVHATTLADEYARRGLDWETQLQQRAREIREMRKLGLTDVDVVRPVTDPTDAIEEESYAHAA